MQILRLASLASFDCAQGRQDDKGSLSMTIHNGPYAPVFTGARKAELDELLTRYPTKMAALLPALWMVQEERGWVPGEGMAEVAELLELTPAYVKGVVTFYTMYHQHPVAAHFIQVCTTSPCNVCGAEDVVNALLKQTGCEELGVTSPDGKLVEVIELKDHPFFIASQFHPEFQSKPNAPSIV